MATGALAPFVRWAAWDSNGDPASGWHLFTYTSGTASKLATYTDVALMSANTNPIVLDSAGRATIFLLPGASYKFVLAPPTDTDPPTSPEWTQDNIESTPASAGNVDVAGVAGENLTGGDACYVSQGDGGRTNGAWYKSDSDVDYSAALARVVGVCVNTVTSGNTGSFRLSGLVTGLAGLVAGSTYYVSSTPGAFSTAPGTFPRRYGVASSSTALVLQPSDRDAGASDGGIVSTLAQTFAGIKTFDDQPLYYQGTQTTFPAAITGTIYSDSVAKTTTGTALETLGTFQFAANTFDTDGKGFKLRVWGKYLANNNNKRNIVVFATNNIIDLTHGATSNAKTFDFYVQVMRVSNTACTILGSMTLGGSSVNDDTPAAAQFTYENVWDTVPSVDFTTPHTVSFRAVDSTLLGGTTQLGFVIELF